MAVRRLCVRAQLFSTHARAAVLLPAVRNAARRWWWWRVTRWIPVSSVWWWSRGSVEAAAAAAAAPASAKGKLWVPAVGVAAASQLRSPLRLWFSAARREKFTTQHIFVLRLRTMNPLCLSLARLPVGPQSRSRFFLPAAGA